MNERTIFVSAKGIFITGTDTGVGKTVVAAVIARLLRDRGCNVGVMKPVTSGCLKTDNGLVSEDAELLKWAAGLDQADGDVAIYLFEEPLAPSVAAEHQGARIDFSRIREGFSRLSHIHDFVIVEGAGGLMVPLVGGLLVADLVQDLQLPMVVVTRPNLGTLNHTFLTTYAAVHLGIETRGIIINNYPEQPGAAEKCAPHLIDSLCGAPLLGLFPHIERKDQREIVEAIATKLEREPATAHMLRRIGAIA